MTAKPNHFKNGLRHFPIPYMRTLWIKTKWEYRLGKGRVERSERWIKASRSPHSSSCSACCCPYAANQTEPYGASALGFCLRSNTRGSSRVTSAGTLGLKRPFGNKTEATEVWGRRMISSQIIIWFWFWGTPKPNLGDWWEPSTTSSLSRLTKNTLEHTENTTGGIERSEISISTEPTGL